MALNSGKKSCVRCEKGFAVANCVGCERWFYSRHFTDHRHELAAEMDHLAQEYDSLRQDITGQDNADQHPVAARIDQWEKMSIKMIKRAAKRAREELQQHLNQTTSELEKNLAQLAKEWQTNREKDEFSEMELKQWQKQLTDLRQQLGRRPKQCCRTRQNEKCRM
jgi:chromosome segregation ATPase